MGKSYRNRLHKGWGGGKKKKHGISVTKCASNYWETRKEGSEEVTDVHAMLKKWAKAGMQIFGPGCKRKKRTGEKENGRK